MTLHLGRFADYDDVRANGRALFHVEGANQRELSLDWLAFDHEVLSNRGLTLDELEAQVNGTQLGIMTDVPGGKGSALLG